MFGFEGFDCMFYIYILAVHVICVLYGEHINVCVIQELAGVNGRVVFYQSVLTMTMSTNAGEKPER